RQASTHRTGARPTWRPCELPRERLTAPVRCPHLEPGTGNQTLPVISTVLKSTEPRWSIAAHGGLFRNSTIGICLAKRGGGRRRTATGGGRGRPVESRRQVRRERRQATGAAGQSATARRMATDS